MLVVFLDIFVIKLFSYTYSLKDHTGRGPIITILHIKIIYISVQGKSIGNIQNYEALEGMYWTT
jgi:hypothetical protein